MVRRDSLRLQARTQDRHALFPKRRYGPELYLARMDSRRSHEAFRRLSLDIMNYSDAPVHGGDYHHRFQRRRGNAGSSRLRRRFGQLILNLCLLVGGGALIGVAIHYYFLGQDYEAKNTLDSADRARGDYGRTVYYTVLGTIPLALGIRREARRLRMRRSRKRR
jgi:hypothetical protein